MPVKTQQMYAANKMVQSQQLYLMQMEQGQEQIQRRFVALGRAIMVQELQQEQIHTTVHDINYESLLLIIML